MKSCSLIHALLAPVTALFLAGVALGQAAETPVADTPPEIGAVHFERDFDAALARAAREHKPVAILFQEIPGCSTCVGFGQGALSHPLLVEALEDLFVPVLVQNNKPGRDAEILARYDEPAWNNPVLRFVDARGKDVVPRKDSLWSTHEVAERLAEALTAVKVEVPSWLTLTVIENDAEHLEQAAFEMHCFWEGEAALGSVAGVVATRAAFLAGAEVVDVTFHAPTLAYVDLVKRADALDCALKVHARGDEQLEAARRIVGARAKAIEGEPTAAKDSDHDHALRASPLARLPFTNAQAMKVNAALARNADVGAWLSPRQRASQERLALEQR